MNGVAKNFLPTEEVGVAKIKRFSINKEEARIANIRSIMNYDGGLMYVTEGDYVKLYVDGILMMSDTPMEKNTNYEFVENAHGDVMVAGLGIGLIIENLREKVNSGKVTSITVYEKYQDVIDLVYPKYKDLPLKVVCEDILEYKPTKAEKYDTIYFDIWPDICTDNLEDIAKLHQRWKSHKRKGGWMNSWMSEYLRNERRRENRNSWW